MVNEQVAMKTLPCLTGDTCARLHTTLLHTEHLKSQGHKSTGSIIYNKMSGCAFLLADMDLKKHVCQFDKDALTRVLQLNKA